MKKNFVITIIGIVSLFLLSSVAMRNAVAADESVAVNIIATVQATCSLSVSTKTVDLGLIPASAFTASPGTLLTSYRGSFTVTPDCIGGDNYNLTLVPSSVNGSCIGTNKDFIAFCVASDNVDFDFSSGSSVLYPGMTSDGDVKIFVTPQVKSGTIESGVVSNSFVTVTINAS